MFSFILLLTILSVSIDGLCLGYALGMSKGKLRIFTFTAIGIIAYIMTSATMSVGSMMFGIVSEKECSIFCACIFFCLSFMALTGSDNEKNSVNVNNFTSALLGGFGVAIDASVAAFALALEGYHGIIYPILFGLAHCVLSYMGYKLSAVKISRMIKEKIPHISAIILCALGIARLI